MKMATHAFEVEGFKVEDVSRYESYDLNCQTQHEILRVEVKGTTTDGRDVLLTPGEVRLANENTADNGVVRGARSGTDRSSNGAPSRWR